MSGNVLTLADWAKRLDPMGKVPTIVELLSQSNPILDDVAYQEGNLPTGHRCTIRTGLPDVFWRLLNQGTQPSKSETAQVDENCGMLEAWSEVDKELAELNGNTAAFRLSEARAFIEAMGQEFAQTLFYGNVGLNPEEFNGLSVRYSSLAAANGQNILSGGGVGSDNSSIWLVVWGDNSAYGIFPKGSKAGLEHLDLGLQTIETTAGIAGNRMLGYRDRFQMKGGLVVKDWRQVVRIPNIDISNLVAKTSAADLVELMIKAIHRIQNLKSGNAVFYMNRSCFQMLDIQRRDDVISGGGLTYNMVDGVATPMFRGIQVRTVDALVETEAVVS
jgi:hypothetical protein